MDVELRTSRLLLRQPRLADAAQITRLLNNFRVAGNLARVPYPYREADALSWLRGWRADSQAAETGFSLDLPGEGVVGNCGFHLDDAGRPVVGYWLGESFWNRGFMSEALAAIVDWYFAATTADTVSSGVFAFNKASLHIQKKLGFTETGESRLHCLARKQEVRHIDTELTRARWTERQGRIAQSQVAAGS
jgi:RimJ/RimL family protein N-acetyltransferase